MRRRWWRLAASVAALALVLALVLVLTLTAGPVLAAVPSTRRALGPSSRPATRAAPAAQIVTIDPAPTPVTARLKDVPAVRLFEELIRRSGVRAGMQSGKSITEGEFAEPLFDSATVSDAKFSAEFDRQPF